MDAFPSNRVSGSSWFNSILSCRIKPILKEDGYIFITGDSVDFGWFSPPRVLLKKSGCKIPRIELEEMGPSLDLVMRRTHLASDDLYKLSLKQPKGLKVCSLERALLSDLSVKKSKGWSITCCTFDQSLLSSRPADIPGATALLWWSAGIQILPWKHIKHAAQILVSKLQPMYGALLLGTWFSPELLGLYSGILTLFFPCSLRRKRISPTMCLVQLMVESTCRSKILVNCRHGKWKA